MKKEITHMPFHLAYGLLFLYALGLLSIGLTSDWHLIHEDNGAMHTTLALSHLRLGLAETRAHDLFFNPQTGETIVYGHHPPLTALILAGAFRLTGSDSPAVARLVPILFHLGSLALLVYMLSHFFSKNRAIFGGFLMATIPMSSYFGRMVNYEPLCLFAIIVQLTGYVMFKQRLAKSGLVWLCAGIFLGGLIDWGAFFFAAFIVLVEAVNVFRRRPHSLSLLLLASGATIAIFLFDLWHLWYAGHGTLTAFQEVLSRDHQSLNWIKFFLGQIDIFRRYFTHTGLVSCCLVIICLVRPGMPFARHLFDIPDVYVMKQLLMITGGAGFAYILAAPSWAAMHLYWQFYLLPGVVLAMTLVWSVLWRKITERHARFFRALAVLFVLEIFVTSAHMLYFRYTKTGGYAVRTTAYFRETFLAPEHFTEKSKEDAAGEK